MSCCKSIRSLGHFWPMRVYVAHHSSIFGNKNNLFNVSSKKNEWFNFYSFYKNDTFYTLRWMDLTMKYWFTGHFSLTVPDCSCVCCLSVRRTVAGRTPPPRPPSPPPQKDPEAFTLTPLTDPHTHGLSPSPHLIKRLHATSQTSRPGQQDV